MCELRGSLGWLPLVREKKRISGKFVTLPAAVSGGEIDAFIMGENPLRGEEPEISPKNGEHENVKL